MLQSLVGEQSELYVCGWGSLANGGGNNWLSYSGIVRVLFPEQLRAVAEGLCRRNVVHSISVLKISMCAACVCPGVHRRFGRFFYFSCWKETGPLCWALLPKSKIFLLWNEHFGGGHIEIFQILLPSTGLEDHNSARKLEADKWLDM